MITGAALSLAAFSALPVSPACAQTAKDAAARALVLEAWTTSRAPELYTQMRHSVRTVMIPASDDLVSGRVKMFMSENPQVVAIHVELNALLKNLDKAGDDIDAVAAKYREELIGDLAGIIAKHMTEEEIEGARGTLRLSATRKGFDAIHAVFGIVTSMSYEEVHANQLFSGFVQQLILKNANRQADAVTQPTPERVAKATAITNEFLTSARIDDMVTDGIRFAREVVVTIAPESEKAKLRVQIDTFEQQYNAQRPMLQILLPTGLATVLDESELEQLQTHMRGPGIAKLYKTIFAAERAITSFTVADIEGAKTYVLGLQARGLFRDRTPEQNQAIAADVNALEIKWKPRMNDAIAPATREAIQKSMAFLAAMSKRQAPGLGLSGKQL